MVERARLEIVYPDKIGVGGSNPPLSAPQRACMKTSFFSLLIVLHSLCFCAKPQPKPALVQDTLPGYPLFVLGRWQAPAQLSRARLDTLAQTQKLYILEKERFLRDSFPGARLLKRAEDLLQAPSEAVLIATPFSTVPFLRTLSVEGHLPASPQYPLWWGPKNPHWADSLTQICLTGTTAITRGLGQVLDQKGTDWLVEPLLPLLKGADWIHTSNEVSFVDTCVYRAGLRFCSKPHHLQEVLLKLGIRIIELTGNHNLDFGEAPYRATLQWYKEKGFLTFGGGLSEEEAYTPLIISLRDGQKVAFIGFNQACVLNECVGRNGRSVGAAPYDSLRAQQIIQRLRQEEKVAFILVGMQFLESDSYAPLSLQRKTAEALIRYGADLVYGSQAHQPQYIAFFQGKPIFYGMGNFLFDQIHREGVRQAFFVRLYFWRGKLLYFEPVFLYMSAERRPRAATAAEAARIWQAISVELP